MAATDLLYRAYERSLVRQLAGAQLPQHVGVILDGNRRFAEERGLSSPSEGHLAGAQRIDDCAVRTERKLNKTEHRTIGVLRNELRIE